MSNPNPNIYGEPDTWINCKYYNVTTLDNNKYRPKIPNFGDNSGSLDKGNNTGKTPINTPIDKTLCPCGQDPTISFWGSVAIFNGRKSNIDKQKIPDKIITQTIPVNWFMYDGAGIGYESDRGYITRRTESPKQLRWTPDALTYDRSNLYIEPFENRNLSINPFVYWNLKSIFINVIVWYITGYNTEGGRRYPVINSVTLNEWKTNYNDKPICEIELVFRQMNGISGETMTYNSNTSGSTGTLFGIGILDDLDGIYNYYSMPWDLRTSASIRLIGSATSQTSCPDSLGKNCQYIACYDRFEDATLECGYDTSYDRYYGLWLEIPYSEVNYEKIMQMTACFGCLFTDIYKTSINTMTDKDLCIPIIDDDGIATGKYTRGIDNKNNDLYNADSIRDKNYDPANPPKNHYEYETNLPTNTGTATNWYSDKCLGTVEPAIQLGNLIQAITQVSENIDNKQFIFQEPLKNVLEYRRILLTQPFDRAYSSEDIPLGAFDCNGFDPPLPFTGFKNFPRFRRETLGSFEFDRKYGNFLDFEPFSQAVLYVPYCGVKQLPMNIFAGHTVNIYLNADNTSGSLQVLIFVDNIEWGTMSGMASEELPLIGETALTAANTKRELVFQQERLEYQKSVGVLGSLAGASISASQRNPAGVILQGLTAALKNFEYNQYIHELNYEIVHTAPEPLTIQTGDSEINKFNVLYPFIMIQSPVLIGENFETICKNYGKTIGFKCCETGTLGNFSGLTKCANANLNGISCTYTEKRMIMEALQEGVIL